MENKVCAICGRELPLSEFHKSKYTKSGYKYWCKECCRQFRRVPEDVKEERKLALKERRKRQREDRLKMFENNTVAEILGGFKVYIMKYTKKGENKYNVVSTAGEVFKTNDKQKFLKYLEGI